jgi:transcription elongation factor SPT6
MYAFCLNPKFPGYFDLCFKAGPSAPCGVWPVKVVPNAFELKSYRYPDMRALKNGFKTLWQRAMEEGARRGGAANGGGGGMAPPVRGR